jgi:hypothetical protein
MRRRERAPFSAIHAGSTDARILLKRAVARVEARFVSFLEQSFAITAAHSQRHALARGCAHECEKDAFSATRRGLGGAADEPRV